MIANTLTITREMGKFRSPAPRWSAANRARPAQIAIAQPFVIAEEGSNLETWNREQPMLDIGLPRAVNNRALIVANALGWR